jgi:3-oxoacyl-[acyl-carrier protein] reductase
VIKADLSKKNIIVTGAKGQLGSSIVASYRNSNANVIEIDIDDIDIRSEDNIKSYFSGIFSKFGHIDVLVNNAGVSSFEDFEKRTKDEFSFVADTNLWGTFNCIKTFVNEFDKSCQKSASIINVGSIYGIVSSDPRIYLDCKRKSPEIYGASKAGIIQMTKYFSVHLAKRNIRVNCISPGGIFNPKQPQGAMFIKEYEKRCPMERMANEADFASSFLLFASDDSSYITGQNLVIDGGFTSW